MDARFTHPTLNWPRSLFTTLDVLVILANLGDQGEGIDFQVSFSTPEAKLTLLETRMQSFVETNNRDYVSADMSIKEVESSNKVKGSFWLQYKGNFQDGGRYVRRKTAFIRALKVAMNDLKMEYMLPAQPIKRLDNVGYP
jgi:hypothetical protein